MKSNNLNLLIYAVILLIVYSSLILKIFNCSLGATDFVGPPKLPVDDLTSLTSVESAQYTLAAFIGQFCENQQLPSIGTHMIVRGVTVLQLAWGYVDAFKKVPASPTTKYRIASNTKPFTACLVGRLVDQGKITFDGSIETYLSPEIFPPKYWKGQKVKMTVGQLLNHTAGVHKTDCDQLTDYEDYGEEYNRTKQFDKFKYEPINFYPGTDYLYSNYGYEIVGKIVEQVEEQSFESVMSSFIAEIGLNNTVIETPELLRKSQTVYFPNESSAREETVTMLQFDGKFVQNECAAAGLQSTASDLAQFGSRIIDTVKGRSNALLSSNTILEMLTRRDNTPYGKYFVYTKVYLSTFSNEVTVGNFLMLSKIQDLEPS